MVCIDYTNGADTAKQAHYYIDHLERETTLTLLIVGTKGSDVDTKLVSRVLVFLHFIGNYTRINR